MIYDIPSSIHLQLQISLQERGTPSALAEQLKSCDYGEEGDTDAEKKEAFKARSSWTVPWGVKNRLLGYMIHMNIHYISYIYIYMYVSYIYI